MRGRLLYAMAIGAVLALTASHMYSCQRRRGLLRAQMFRAAYEAEVICQAVRDYDFDYRTLPELWKGRGVISASILRILTGEVGLDADGGAINARRIVFLLDPPGDLENSLEWRDPWSNYYEFEISTEWIRVWSNGPDGIELKPTDLLAEKRRARL